MRRTLALIFRYNLRSLSVRNTDAVMTLFSVALCSAVVVVVSALERGVESAFRSSGAPDVALLLRKGARTEIQSRIDLEAANLARGLEGIVGAEVSKEVVVIVTLPRRADGKSSNVMVRGVDAAGIALRPGFRLVWGRAPSPNGSEVCVSRRMSDRITGLGPGETFTFGKFQFSVVGLFEAGGTNDSEVWGPVAQVQAAFDRAGGFSALRARLAGAGEDAWQASLANVAQQLEGNARLPLKVVREVDYYASQEESAAEIPKALGRILTVLMAIGAGVGAMNTMYARVAARTREVATLRALGYGRTSIVLAFLAEAAVLGVVGGGLGALAASAVHGYGTATTSLATASEVAFTFVVTQRAVLLGIGLAAGIGAAGGLLPALGAARRAIPEALRE